MYINDCENLSAESQEKYKGKERGKNKLRNKIAHKE